MKNRISFTALFMLILLTFGALAGLLVVKPIFASFAAPTSEELILFQGGIVPAPELAQQQRPSGHEAAPDSWPTMAQTSGSIAYSSNHNGEEYDILIQNANGAPPTWLAQSGNDATPRWSPDGQHLVFASDRDGDFEIYIRFADGSQRQLTNNSAQDIHPSWSPDGQHIIFSSNQNGSYYQIYTVDIDGSNLRQITNISRTNALSPVYAPDGGRIAFMRSSILTVTCSWNWDIWVMNADGGNHRRMTSQLGADVYPAWSPDGQHILYAECGLFDLDFDLHRVNIATGQTQYVMGSFLTNEWGGVYAPDAQHIAYSQSVTGAADIYIYNLAQETKYNLSNNPGDDLAPHWRREVIADVCDSANPARQPVMMVTGWSGSEGKAYLAQDEQLHFFRNWLGKHGYVEGCNLFYAAETSPHEDLLGNARIIHQQLCQAANVIAERNSNWNGRFDIIAYSYGGLRSRAFIEGTLYDDACQTENWGRRVYVDHLYTMGTPHGGEWPNLPFSIFILNGALKDDAGVQWPAIIEMLPPVRAWQNRAQSQPDAIACYHLLGGDGRPQVAYLPSLLFLTQLWPFTLASPNDLAVHQTSAHDLLHHAGNYSRAHYVQTPDLHGQVPWYIDPLNVLRSFVNPETTFAQQIKPFLLREQTGCPLIGLQNRQQTQSVVEMAAQQQQPQTLPPVTMIDLGAGRIADNQTFNGQFNVTTAEKSQLSLYWSAGDLRLTLTDPQGRAIHPGNVADIDNINYLELDTGYGLMAAYQITNTLTGLWRYQIEAGSLEQPAFYQLMRLPETQIAVTGILPAWQPFSTPVVVAARVTIDGGTPVTGGAVTAEIHRPDGQTDLLTLFDDGQHQDGEANDGLSANNYTGANVGGFYSVTYRATGAHQARAYERTHTAVFSIGSAAAVLSNHYRDTPLDNNGDGLYEALQVQVGLNVNSSGKYTLSAELYAGDNFVARASRAHVSLTAGARAIRLLFDGEDIRQSGLNGPYTLRNVLLLDETEVTLLLEAADNVHTTAAYRADQFGTPTIYLPLLRRP
jgi:Tol biopolymer transport system component